MFIFFKINRNNNDLWVEFVALIVNDLCTRKFVLTSLLNYIN